MTPLPAGFLLRLFILLLVGGTLLVSPGCSSTRYYNRYPKEKRCAMKSERITPVSQNQAGG